MTDIEIGWRQYIELFMLTVIIIWFAVWTFIQRKDIMGAIKGPDGRMDLVDVVTAMWLVLFPLMVITNMFLDLEVKSEVWYSMDAIMAFILGKKGYEKGMELKNGKKKDETPTD